MIVVVGAGPAGLATALLLASRGIGVTLVEREPDFERVFRGEGLMPSGVDALRQIAGAEIFERVPNRDIESWKVFIDGEAVFEVPEPAGERRAKVVSQPALLGLLFDQASRYEGFRYRAGERVRDLLREGDRIVGVEVETSQGRKELRADLVIGADGRGSVVRTRAGIVLERMPVKAGSRST